MKITFKDVGQGDTIIVEWADPEGKWKIGIIDCKLKGRGNPVVEYLKNSEYKEIEFLILSHPHADHYSGFLGLLNYLQECNYPIHRVGHTIGFTGAESYWKYFEISSDDIDEFESIIQKWFDLKDKGLIKRIDLLCDGKVLDIDDSFKITCLSPSHDDMQEYQRKVKLDAVVHNTEARLAANILSTILKLTFYDHNFLLTSDAELYNFKGVLARDSKHIADKRFHICQIPHHGSLKNYSKDFWELIQVSSPQHAIASAGNGYGHPSLEVLRNFHNVGYNVHCTNIVNGMKLFIDIIEERSKLLDIFSELADEYRSSNDRTFVLEGDSMKLVV